VNRTDASSGDPARAISEIVMDIRGRQHRLCAFGIGRRRIDALFDSALALAEFASDTGFT
jgi:hypothetical protein